MKKTLKSKALLASLISYIGMYAIWIGLTALAVSINDIVMYIFMGISCIIAFKTCKKFLSDTIGGLFSATNNILFIILGVILGITISAIVGLLVAPFVLAGLIRPFLLDFFHIGVVDKSTKEDLIQARNDLFPVYKLYMGKENYSTLARVAPKAEDVKDRISDYGCSTYGDMESLFNHICTTLEEKNNINCKSYILPNG